MKMLALHIVSIILYFPVVIVLFLYLIFRPDKMTTFFLGMEVITNILAKKKNT